MRQASGTVPGALLLGKLTFIYNLELVSLALPDWYLQYIGQEWSACVTGLQACFTIESDYSETFVEVYIFRDKHLLPFAIVDMQMTSHILEYFYPRKYARINDDWESDAEKSPSTQGQDLQRDRRSSWACLDVACRILTVFFALLSLLLYMDWRKLDSEPNFRSGWETDFGRSLMFPNSTSPDVP